MHLRLLVLCFFSFSLLGCNRNSGCTEFGSENYDSDAVVDDGSCVNFRDKFIGVFNVNSDCITDGYQLTIQEGQSDNEVTISNLSDTLNVLTARVYGDNITIDLQTVATSVNLEGAGVYVDTNAISLSYRFRDSRTGAEVQTDCIEWCSKIVE